MLKANSLEEVILHLDDIINWSKTNQSRIGYFTVLYRRMTVAVQAGILANAFEDGDRMEKLDVIFANRYLQAWDAYVNKRVCTNAWTSAFDACESKDLTVLQHLIMGINTHINLDLGIAAAELCPGDTIHALQKDFDHINVVIADLSHQIQETLCRVWFPLRLLGKISKNSEKAVLNFSIDTARRVSWTNALALAMLDPENRETYIRKMDDTVVLIAAKIAHPGFFVQWILTPVRWMESKDISKLIDTLQDR